MNIGNFILRFLLRQVADRITADPFARRFARGVYWVLVIAYAVHATWASVFAYRVIAKHSEMSISSESRETAPATTTWS